MNICSYIDKDTMTSIQQETCLARTIHTERVEKARRNCLPTDDQDKLVNLFKAMGDPTRLKILFALASGEMCVCDLASFLEITESAVSHQLRVLRQLYLVANRREGPILYYHLNDLHIEQLIGIGLDHVRE
jgi:DNA-binding transcriptional ArsR family regulator